MNSTRKKDDSAILRSACEVALVIGMCLLAFFPASGEAASAYLETHAPLLIEKVERSYGHLIDEAALRHDTDPNLILAVVVVESEGNPRALSRRGAVGLMQLMPGTAKALGVVNPRDPRQNILGGTRYLDELSDHAFLDSVDRVLVAYNMGPANAKYWLKRNDPKRYAYVQNVRYVYALIEERELREGGYREGMLRLAQEWSDAMQVDGQPIATKPRTLSFVELPEGMTVVRRSEVRAAP